MSEDDRQSKKPLAPKPPEPPPKRSGEHPAVVGFRKRLESIDERTMPLLQNVSDRMDAAVSSSTPPPAEPIATNWRITVSGFGSHHNGDAGDANRLLAAFVKTLTNAGHQIASATFTNGDVEHVVLSKEDT